MLDIKIVRANPQAVIDGMKKRGMDLDLTEFQTLDESRRKLLVEVEELKNRRNTVSKEIGRMKKAGENADDMVAEMGKVGDEIKAMDEELRVIEGKLNDIMLSIPNIPDATLPVGGEDDYRVERTWGEPKQYDFEPLAHWDIGEGLDILILSARPRSPAHASPSTKAWARN